MDRILIEGLSCLAHVGVPGKERRRRQKILLDLELAVNLREAGRRDEVGATVDYASVTAEVKKLAEGGSFRLVEAMAEQVAERLLSRFKADQVRVRIRKFSVPGAESVGVEIIRGSLRTTGSRL